MSNVAGRVDVVLGANNVGFTEAMKKAQKDLDDFAGKSKTAGHASVNSTQAASAALRVMQGDMTNNIRAVERFVGAIPGVGSALKIAFPLVGGIAFASLIVNMGMKVAAFIKTVDEMPQAIQKGFQSLALSQKTANDELDVTNDKLQNSIDKLEHKPTDGLKLGMDEAKTSADHLAESITGASDKLDELLSKNHITGMQALWGMWGTVSTAGVEGTAKYFNQKISTASSAYANDPSDKNHAAMVAAINDALKEARATAAKETAKRDAPASWAERFAGPALGLSGPLSLRPDNSNVLYDAQGAANYYQGMLRTDKSTTTNQALTKQQAADQAKKEAVDLAKQQTEAAKAAATARVAAMQTALDAMKLQYGMSIKAVYDYWDGMKAGELAGGNAYNEIVKKQVTLAVEGATKAHETILKAIADAKRNGGQDATAGPDLINSSARFMRQQAVSEGNEQTQGYVDSNQLAIEQASNDAREKETQLTDAAGKSISRYAAATQIANVHTQEFITTQTALQAILDARTEDQKTNPSKENERAVTAAQIALANAQTQRGLQIVADANNANPPATSMSAGFADAINDFVSASRDGADQMRGLVTNTLQGLNQQIVGAMSGQRTNFRNFGAGVFRSVAGTALEKGEGSLLGAFGGGKLGASSANAMWVRMANSGAVSGIASAASSVVSKTSGAAGFFGSILKAVLPGFANGTPYMNGPAIVGEQGPELFIPSGSGSIIPNHKLMAVGNSGGSPNITVNAPGSTDPAQTRVQVMRGIQAAAPHIAASTINAQRDQNLRKPPSARR